MLEELLGGHQPQQVQIAAIQALSRFERREVAEIIIDAWPALTPAVRGEAAEALFSKQSRLTLLLDAVEQEQIAPSQQRRVSVMALEPLVTPPVPRD